MAEVDDFRQGRALQVIERDISNRQQKISALQSRISSRESAGKTSGGSRARLSRLLEQQQQAYSEYESLRSRLGTEGEARARESAPRDFNLGRGTGSREDLREARRERREVFVASGESRQASQAEFQSAVRSQTRKGNVTLRTSEGVELRNEGDNLLVGVRPASFSLRETQTSSSASFSPYTPATFSPDEPGRPLYTSSVFINTNQGTAEVFETRDSRGQNQPSPTTPTFAQQRRRDTLRFQELSEQNMTGDSSRRLANLAASRFVSIPGLFLERGSQRLDTTLENSRYRTTPIRLVAQAGTGLGEFARTNPTGVVTETNTSLILGGVGGRVFGAGLRSIASGRAGRLGLSRVGFASSSSLRSIRQAQIAQNVGTGVIGVGVALDIGRVVSTEGGEGVGRRTPMLVGGAIGFSSGLRASGATSPQLLSRGSTRFRDEFFSVERGSRSRVLLRARGSQDVTVSGFGQEIPGTARVRGEFSGRVLEGGDVAVGTGRVSRSFAEEGIVLRDTTLFRGSVSASGVFEGQPSRGLPSFGGVSGRQNIRIGTDDLVLSGRNTVGFQFTNNRLVGSTRGQSLSESFESPVFRASPRQLTPQESDFGVVQFRSSPLRRTGSERIFSGASESADVVPSLGRGSRGRLSRVLALRDRRLARRPVDSFRELFSARESFGASLNAPIIINRGRSRSVIREPTSQLEPGSFRPSSVFGSVPLRSRGASRFGTASLVGGSTSQVADALVVVRPIETVRPATTPDVITDSLTRESSDSLFSFDTSSAFSSPSSFSSVTGGVVPGGRPGSQTTELTRPPLLFGLGGGGIGGFSRPRRRSPARARSRFTRGLRSISGLRAPRGSITARRLSRTGLTGFEVRV